MIETSLQIGLPGGFEMLIVLGIVVLLFGANKLPELARSSGQAMGEFTRGREGIEAELKEGMNDDPAPEAPDQAESHTEAEHVVQSD